MMLRMQGRLPRDLVVAVSGGADSCAVAHFLSRKHPVTLLYVDHCDGNAKSEWDIVRHLARQLEVPVEYKQIGPKPAGENFEAWGSRGRLKCYREYGPSAVVTAHHLDDCVENWIMTSMHGNGTIIPYSNKNVLRPFRLETKANMEVYCREHDIPFFHDPTNDDANFATRNFVRLNMHLFERINPGIRTVVRKKVLADEPQKYETHIE